MENITKDLQKLSIPITSVNANLANTRKHEPENIEILKNSLSKYGQRKPIVVQKKNMVVRAGNGCLAAATALGWTHIAAVVVDEGSTDATGYEIMDNRSAEKGSDWDFEILGKKLAALKEEDFDLDMVGFSDDEFNNMLDELTPEGEAEEDEAPEAVADPVVKTGDLWLLGDHRLLCGDCTKAEDVERVMCGEKADMVFTDPPYGVNHAGRNTFLNSIDKGDCNQTPIVSDDLKEEDICKLWKQVFEILRDNLAEVNSYYIFGPQIQAMMMMMMMEAGLPYRHVLIWVKNNHVLGRCDYNYKHEPILFGWTTKHKFYGKGEFQTSVWEVARPHKSDLHSTMKPIRLMVNGLLNSSKRNDICIDPFLGSGSTLLACEQLNRRCYGLEISPAYCQVILERYRNLTNKEPILEATGKPFSGILPKELT